MKVKVYVELKKEHFHKDAIDVLSDIADLIFEPLSNEEFKKIIAEASAAIIGLKRIDEEFLAKAPKLKIVARYGVGYDNIDVNACTKRGIYVTYTPDVLSDAVADLTFALILSLTRKICKADKYVRTEWAKGESDFPLGVDLKGKNIGIIGMGRIGYQVAKRAYAFGMNILYYSRTRKKDIEKELNAKFTSLDELLKNSDIVSIHVPLNEKTKGMIGERELSLMKKSAYLINTSRGAIIDQYALIKFLKEKRIEGAGLDVFEKEPIPLNDPLLQLDNVVLTPHIGSATIETRRAMAMSVAESVLSVLKGKVPKNLVPEQVTIFSRKENIN
jgi:D-3-phosphoglycerate dehydrogenase